MNHVIIDTSSILFGFQNKKNLFDIVKYKLNANSIVSSGIIKELEKKALSNGNKGAYAKIALKAMSNANITVKQSRSNVDSWIYMSAIKNHISVVTNDTALSKKLLSHGISVYKLSRNGMLRKL
ncbi:MAG: hypothetical protein ACP5TL_02150 [Candidatus Micrarchaeia archaeon]